MANPTILCVDDEVDNVDALERLFRSKYTVLKSTSGAQALEILDQYPDKISVIITDQRMPEMTGVEFLAKTIEKLPDASRILLTGYTDIQSVIAAVNSGQIFKYVTKPWDPVDLMATVDRAHERYKLGMELQEKNRALKKALTELQSLDQAKNQFMILINHELKTPLTSILSFSELLSETPLNEEQELCLNRVRKSAERLRSLIDDVLVVVAGETKTLKTKVQPFESSELKNQIKKEAALLNSQKNQTFHVDVVEKKIVGDFALINQVMRRLLHNSIKFGKERSEIKIESKLISPHRLKFSIFNEGEPISENVKDKVLKPFFIDEDVMNHSVGMGLGLTVCQSILKAHASGLSIENKKNGVEVSFELPCL